MKQWIRGGRVFFHGEFYEKTVGFENGIVTDVVDTKDFDAAGTDDPRFCGNFSEGGLPEDCLSEGSFSEGGLTEDCLSEGIFSEGSLSEDNLSEGGLSCVRRSDQDQIIDARGCYVVPGFVDIHTHGGYGFDVNASRAEDFEKIGHFFAAQGTTSWLCSILTDTKTQTLKTIGEAVSHMKSHSNCANLAGIHLEGPFLSEAYKGAMPAELLMKPDIDLVREYQKAADGNIRYMTVSPEVEGVPEAIPQIKDLGIAVAIGHSGADYETAVRCIDSGAVCATHTFNAMRLFHHHEPAIMGAVLEHDIYCEAICDGRHLHPGAVRLLVKVKGRDRITAITDSIMAAGLPDGDYKLGVNDVVVKDGDARLKTSDVRAGSTLTMNQALKNIMHFTGMSPAEALPMLTINPARVIGLQNRIGSIEGGKDADLLILDADFNVKQTYVKGILIR